MKTHTLAGCDSQIDSREAQLRTSQIRQVSINGLGCELVLRVTSRDVNVHEHIALARYLRNPPFVLAQMTAVEHHLLDLSL